MVFKGNLSIDPRGLIFESYRIENITIEECRMIFLDWALEVAKSDMTEDINTLLSEYKEIYEDHPMTEVLLAGYQRYKALAEGVVDLVDLINKVYLNIYLYG